jgi:hypothetical protein
MPVDKHVIDTNVLLVASAAHAMSPFAPNATPVEAATLRQKVLDWLIAFEDSDRQMVLDWHWVIVDEYRGVGRRDKLADQDYGLQVVLQKFSTGQTFGFTLNWIVPDGAEIVHAALDLVITDHADRKMVAGVLAAGGRTGGCTLVNSCDTDWYDWQSALEDADVFVDQLIPEWCHPKWMAKKAR